MKILVLGGGLMGPAAAYNALQDAQVTGVTLADMSAAQLANARARLVDKPNSAKLTTVQLDLHDHAAATQLMGQHDAIVAALPSTIIATGLRAAIAARIERTGVSFSCTAFKSVASCNSIFLSPK